MKYFSNLLQNDDDANTAFRDVVPNPSGDDGVEIPPPSHEPFKVTIMRLKNNKAAGFGGELFKTGCYALVQNMAKGKYTQWLEPQ